MSEIVAPIITDSTGQAIATAISGAVSKADKSDIAPDFSTSADYAKGSMVYYQGTLYEFTAAHNHAAWTGSDVIAVKVSSEINTLKSGLTNCMQTISKGYLSDETATIDITGGMRGLLFTSAIDANAIGAYMISTNTSGNVMANVAIKEASAIAITQPEALKLTISTTSVQAVYYNLVAL